MAAAKTLRTALQAAPAPGPLALVALVSLASLLQGACAGAGHAYACESDAGACVTGPGDGGGAPANGFIGAAALIFHDGAHNSDVDVAAFNGALYAVFRSSASYAVSAAASLNVFVSRDQGATWTKTANLALAGMDLREPKLNVFAGALRVTATAWNPVDQDFHHTNVVTASSTDGSGFSTIADTGIAAGSEAWRPKPIGAQLWMTAWMADEIYPDDTPNDLQLYASQDGTSFGGGVALPVGPGARQGELLVRADGSLWLTIPERAETGTVDEQTICHGPSAPPFSWTCWSAAQSPIGSPALFEFNGILFVSGEHDLPDGRARTGLWQVDNPDQQFNLIADLPQSEGETGSPGILGLDQSRVLLTYHSTSTLDPRVQALGSEPTTLQSEAEGYAVDALAVILDMDQIPAGD